MIISPPAAFKPSSLTDGSDYGNAWYLQKKLQHWRMPGKAGCRGMFSSALLPATANVSSLVAMLYIVPCAMQNQVKATAFMFELLPHWNKIFHLQGCRAKLTTLLRWNGITCLQLIFTENGTGTIWHLNKNIRHLKSKIER